MRRSHLGIVLLGLLLLVPLVGTRAFGQDPTSDVGFPMKHSQAWEGQVIGIGGARADCTLQSEDSRTSHINIEASGLRPGVQYSFWLADGADRVKGLGSEPFTAQADGRGDLTYRALLNFCPDTKNVDIIIREVSPGEPAILSGTITRQ